MGCDTSKESVQQAAEDTVKDEIKKAVAGAAVAESATERRTSKSDGETGKSEPVETPPTEEDSQFEDLNTDEVAAAATRIQAVFRGHHARKSMKAATEVPTPSRTSVKSAESSEPSQQQLRDEFRADDRELCHAATKIQASFRGHMSRKAGEVTALGEMVAENTAGKIGKLIDGTSAAATAVAAAAAAKIDEKMDDALNELDGIDLKDPDLHKAATKIQASFRGHKVRQEVAPFGTLTTE